MRDALNGSGRPIFFSNEYPAAHENYPPYGEKGQYNFTWMVQNHGKAMGEHANMWRISQDIGASCESLPAVCAVAGLRCMANQHSAPNLDKVRHNTDSQFCITNLMR